MNTQSKTLLIKQELKAMLTIKSDTTIRNLELKDPTFPTKIAIGFRRVGYRLQDVQDWLKSKEVSEELRNA